MAVIGGFRGGLGERDSIHIPVIGLQWGTKILGQLIQFTFLSPPFPQRPSPPPSNVVVCAALYTLACPGNVSLSQHCLEGVGRAILSIDVFREVQTMLHSIITGAQPKAGTGHKMQTISVVFSTLHC